MKEAQRQALLRRNEIVPMMQARADEFGLTYDRLFGTPDKALELLVIEMPFTFWQFGLQNLCPSVPTATASTQEIFDFLDAVQVFDIWTDGRLLHPAVSAVLLPGRSPIWINSTA